MNPGRGQKRQEASSTTEKYSVCQYKRPGRINNAQVDTTGVQMNMQEAKQKPTLNVLVQESTGMLRAKLELAWNGRQLAVNQ